MEVQHWIYIIIGLIYFLSKFLKKSEQPPVETPDPMRRRATGSGPAPVESERPKPLTFEELLREITEGKQPPKPVFQPAPYRKYETFDENLEDEARSLENVTENDRDDAAILKSYERANSQVPLRSSLEETLSLKDTVMDFGKFKVFEEQKKRNLAIEYFKIFRNREGIKQAVVMSEILKRKF
jgi:hypothetical protein